jgi:hypothetical protein
MSLLTIDNKALTLEMYLPLLKSFNFPCFANYLAQISLFIESSFWTSASSEGLSCGAERMFAWCTSGIVVDEGFVNNSALWTAIPTENETLANCVTLGDKNGSSAQLSLGSCSESNPFMCQV